MCAYVCTCSAKRRIKIDERTKRDAATRYRPIARPYLIIYPPIKYMIDSSNHILYIARSICSSSSINSLISERRIESEKKTKGRGGRVREREKGEESHENPRSPVLFRLIRQCTHSAHSLTYRV